MDILKINEANCKDCHKCIRYCPVNAISFTDGHAQIDKERCILDGSCYNVCPQDAKFLRDDVAKVKELIDSDVFTVASIAPSFLAYYQEPELNKMLSMIRNLGFDYIELTSRTAKDVALAHADLYNQNQNILISSSCPAVVLLIEKYYPELLNYLAPVDSPMVAHYKKLLRQLDKKFEMVFIGPCIAKKEEITHTNIPVALTFEELERWVNYEDITQDLSSSNFFDNYYSEKYTMFPLLGGLIESAGIQESCIKKNIISVSGIDQVKDVLESIKNKKLQAPRFIELLACENGCIMGPARPDKAKNIPFYELKENIIDNLNRFKGKEDSITLNTSELRRNYKNKAIKIQTPPEEEIQAVLNSIDKFSVEDELNCGSCGYDSCREKAIAVINGLAEQEMCIPYMKNKYKKFSAILLDTNPNGVLVLNESLRVIEVNKAFLELFNSNKEDIVNKHISLIANVEPYKKVLETDGFVSQTQSMLNGKKMKKIIYSIKEEKIIICFLIDLSDIEAKKEELQSVKRETLDRAQKVVNKQMRVAQEIASLLGETTAETKVLLGQLIKVLQKEDE